jgi:hypothetical protein
VGKPNHHVWNRRIHDLFHNPLYLSHLDRYVEQIPSSTSVPFSLSPFSRSPFSRSLSLALSRSLSRSPFLSFSSLLLLVRSLQQKNLSSSSNRTFSVLFRSVRKEDQGCGQVRHSKLPHQFWCSLDFHNDTMGW